MRVCILYIYTYVHMLMVCIYIYIHKHSYVFTHFLAVGGSLCSCVWLGGGREVRHR